MALEIKAVAFDLDGTLYPNYRLNLRLIPFVLRHARLLAAFAKARNIIRRERGQFREQESRSRDTQPDFYDYQARLAAKILKESPEQIKEKIENLIYTGWVSHFSKIKLFPCVIEFLDKLRAAKFKLGLLSDFPPRKKLENLGIAGYWDTVLCSEDFGTLKPAGRPFEALADALCCPAEQILYVGNSRRYDVGGAKRAGMKTALKTSRFGLNFPCKSKNKADFSFHNYRQLLDFMLQ